MSDHKLSTKCRVCGGGIEAFMTFGRMPIANGFLKPSEVASEYFFELAPAFCETCKMFQIVEQPDATKMFHENYAFYSSTSRYMQAHFERYANFVISKFYNPALADEIAAEHGRADAILAANVMCHIPDINGVGEGIKRLLKPD